MIHAARPHQSTPSHSLPNDVYNKGRGYIVIHLPCGYDPTTQGTTAMTQGRPHTSGRHTETGCVVELRATLVWCSMH